MKSLFQSVLLCLFCSPLFLFAQNEKVAFKPVQLEHLRMNVADKEATAKWYVENLGLEIIPTKSKEFVYVADKDHNFMLELSSIPNLKNTYFDVHFDSFHIAFEGHKSINAVSEKMLANGGKQEGALYTNKIGDYVMNIRDPNGFNTQLLHRVNLEHLRNKKTGDLAHGQQRALEIAMALACNPSLLLLDEPTAGMSPEETLVMMELIRTLASERTVILVEHKMKLIMGLCKRIIVLHHGEFLAEGTPEEIQNNAEVRRVYLGQG